MEDPEGVAAIAALFGGVTWIIGLIIAVVIAVLIGRDAAKRGMSAWGWGIFTFLICIVAIPIYLIVRKPRLDEQGT